MTYDFLTAQDILTPSRDEAIGSSSSQITALEDTQVIEFLHSLNAEFILEAHIKHHAKGWSWMKKFGNFPVVKNDTLSESAAVGASTFKLTSAADWDDDGRSVIETNRGALDFVAHESKSSKTFTVSTTSGDPGITIAHATDRIYKLYKAEADFGRMHGLSINTVPYDEEKLAMRYPKRGFYMIWDNFIFLPRGLASSDASYLYEKKPDEISAMTSTTNIPRLFKRWAIEMTLHHLFKIKRKRADAPTSLALAENALIQALEYDSINATSTQIRLAN